jgi:lysozyme family protein
MKGNFAAVFKEVLGHEGGFTDDRRDKGNWTGGEVGKGKLLGTKFGISAQTYPDVDIKNLTVDQARTIYKRDFWDLMQGDELPIGVDLVAFDAAVNSGRGRSVKWLQAAAGGIKIDGLLGPGTLEAIKGADPVRLIKAACFHRLDFLDDLPTWPVYGDGWKTRVNNVQARALLWLKTPPAPVAVATSATVDAVAPDMATRMGVPAVPRVIHQIAGEEELPVLTLRIILQGTNVLSCTVVKDTDAPTSPAT